MLDAVDQAGDSTAAADLERARGLLAGARRVVVLSGAGISTDSGIPDFRGPDGVWTKDPDAEMLSTYDVYVNDAHVRRRAWRSRLESPTWTAVPNPGHEAIVALERSGRLVLLVTQNIDRLHHDAGSDPSLVVEIHGNAHEVVCLRCQDRRPMAEALARVAGGEDDPRCEVLEPNGPCGGILKSATISFGQSLVPADLERCEQVVSTCDLLLCVGSTLSVYPAAGLVPLARRAGASVVIVNGAPTAMDELADVVVRADLSSALRALVEDF